MLFRKKIEKMSYSLYWERVLGYNYNTEFAIYNYLCDRKIKRKELKNLPANKRFNTYSEWENYVKSQYCNAPVSELKEFIRYLNYENRINGNRKILNSNILTPMMVTILSVWVMPFIFEINKNYDRINNLGVSSNIVKGVLFVIIPMVQVYFVAGVILWFVIIVSSAIVNNKQEEAYHEDYMKIINDIIIKST
jgi:hypothetical protein